MKPKTIREQAVDTLLSQLCQTAGTIEKDDLGGLAKMHSWCEALVSAVGEQADQAAALVSEQTKSIAQLLEAIILGEAKDPDAAMGSVVAEANGLRAILGGNGLTDGASVVLPNRSRDHEQSRDREGAVPSDASRGGEAAELDGPPADARCSDPARGDEAAAATRSETPAQHMDATDAGRPRPSVEDSEQGVELEEAPYEQLPLKLDVKELEFIRSFLEEAREHIEAIEAALLGVERSPDDKSNIDNLFRPFHTIKGMAGFLNLRDINCLTHEAETLMDQARKGKREVTPGLIDLVFDVVDILKAQVSAVAGYVAAPTEDGVPQPPIAAMIAKLRRVVAGRIDPTGRQPAAGGPDRTVGQNLVEQGACAEEVVEIAAEAQRNTKPDKKIGEILVGIGATTAKQVSQALRSQASPAAAAAPAASGAAVAEQSVRIDTTKLDGLVDMVGELVIAQTLVAASPSIGADNRLSKDVNQVGKIVRDVQELAMSMRMVPIGATFQKMARVVRDVSRKAGKKVELSISGEDTEMDKNMIQQIGDPLVHMVRNAVDHGVEPPEDRRAAGKEETGVVRLAAYHQGGNIVIEVSDDGRGMNPKTLIAKGVEKGLVQPGEELTDQQAFALVFAPGFSMAKEVTDISGRGVGMDVVRRNIEQLRGKVEIASEIGKGSTFQIRLPLTLAIIDGMVIKAGDERFIIPTIVIEQALRPRPEQISTVQHRGEILNVRGRLIPLVQLGRLFGLAGRVDPCQAMVVIAQCEGRQIGLVVDELIGQQQVVIKTLGQRFQRLRGVSGAAILGDGRVGLILEIAGLAAAHRADSQTRLADEESGRIPVRPDNDPEGNLNPSADMTTNQPTADRDGPVLVGA